jgi:hypothetical protein
MLDVIDDRTLDIIIVEEGNAEARDAVGKSASYYGY